MKGVIALVGIIHVLIHNKYPVPPALDETTPGFAARMGIRDPVGFELDLSG
jgi:hypothetical protein